MSRLITVTIGQPSTTGWNSGVYEGAYDGTGVPPSRDTEVTAFQTMRNRPVKIVIDFASAATSTTWATIENPGPLDNMAGSSYKGTAGAGFELCTPILPWDAGGTSGTDLARGASGSYNAHWTTFGGNLVANGLTSIALRIGHEFNGNWYRWSVNTNYNGGNPNGGVADYVSYFRNIVTTTRAAGWTGQSVWCVNNGVSGTTAQPELAYPGDAYVDIISVDAYDQSWASGSYPYLAGDTAAQRATRQDIAWDDILNGSRGLDYWKNFAATHGKKLAVSEWGVFTRPSDGHGGMDNPSYINRMYTWFSGCGSLLAYESYFNFSASDGDHYLGPNATAFPLSAAQYNTLWG